MNWRVPQMLVGGLIGGALTGFLVGGYVVVVSSNYVVQRDDFLVPAEFDLAWSRYRATVLFAFVAVFAIIGPFIAAASFGLWIRHAVYGLVASIALVVAVALIVALVNNELPFNRYKGAASASIDIARIYALPGALVVGPLVGVLVGACVTRLIRAPSSKIEA